jgi:heme exporter protein A
VNNVITIELKNVSKSFGERSVLESISLAISSGCLVITGPNGSGKSTLLRIISGLISPTSGEVVFKSDGKLLPVEARRDLIGMVAPDLSLYEELSALENLRFFSRVRGLKIEDTELKSALENLGLAGREDDHLSSYSSGMRQRVKYAYATLHKPPVLLLDEPSTNLDEVGIEVITKVTEDYRKLGIVIIATNQPSELSFGDNVLRLGA